jgi:hypothetical protein
VTVRVGVDVGVEVEVTVDVGVGVAVGVHVGVEVKVTIGAGVDVAVGVGLPLQRLTATAVTIAHRATMATARINHTAVLGLLSWRRSSCFSSTPTLQVNPVTPEPALQPPHRRALPGTHFPRLPFSAAKGGVAWADSGLPHLDGRPCGSDDRPQGEREDRGGELARRRHLQFSRSTSVAKMRFPIWS